MITIDVFTPAGTISDDERHLLAERLVTDVVAASGAPADLIERARAMTWVVVHEPSAWHVGPKPADEPVYLVRVTVPAGHANDAMRAEMISRIDRALRPPHSGDEPAATAWIHVIEQPDGHLAINGDVMRLADITHAIVNPDVAPPPKPASDDDAKAPIGIDPICGMSVTIDPDPISLTTDGTTHYFCSPTCRQLYSTTGTRHDP